MTIPTSVLMKMATIGLSEEQAMAVAEMLSVVEKATEETCNAVVETSRGKARERVQRWRERLDISPSEWDVISLFVRKRDGYTCVYCGETDGPMHCDHVVPLIQGGRSSLDNLVTACRACNGGKSGRTLKEWRS